MLNSRDVLVTPYLRIQVETEIKSGVNCIDCRKFEVANLSIFKHQYVYIGGSLASWVINTRPLLDDSRKHYTEQGRHLEENEAAAQWQHLAQDFSHSQWNVQGGVVVTY